MAKAKTETLGQCLQRLRVAAGMTQEALAQAAGLPAPSIRNYEQGHRVPTLVAAYQLAQALHVPLEELAACAMPPKPAKPTRRRRSR